MKLDMVTIYDSAVGAYMRPFFAPSRAAAVRSFGDEVNRVGSEMHAHPDDYALCHVGVWDDASGMFEGTEVDVIVRGKDVIRV